MEEKIPYVSQKVAMLAKKAGFDLYCDVYYRHNYYYAIDEDNYVKWNFDFKDDDHKCTAPRQGVLQMWLRGKKFHVVITPEFYKTGINYNWQVLIYDPEDEHRCIHKQSSMMYGANGEYPEYHLALEAGLEKALKLYCEINNI